jgi:hypothetical protein
MAGMRACAACGHEVEGNYREVIGFERVRRGGGGLNRLIHRRETGRYLCNACGWAINNGATPGDLTLPGLTDDVALPPIVTRYRDHA